MKLLAILKGMRIMKYKAWLKTCRRFDTKRWFLDLTLCFSILILSAPAWAQAQSSGRSISADISRIGDATHLEFRGLAQWNYDLKKLSDKQYELKLPSLDDKSIALLNTWTDQLVSRVEVIKGEGNPEVKILLEVSDKGVESFDYLTDQPSRLIVDFYKLVEPEAKVTAPVQAPGDLRPKAKTNPSTPKTASLPESPESQYTKVARGGARAPAGSEVLSGVGTEPPTAPAEGANDSGFAFDAADPNFDRFRMKDYEIQEEALIASRKNIYIRFPTLKMPYSLLPDLEKSQPEYVINPRNDRENKEARFLLELYHRHIRRQSSKSDRIGAFLKVYDHFEKSYRDSEYDEIIKNIAARMFLLKFQRDGHQDDLRRSIDITKYLVSKYPQSPLAERNQLWVASMLADRGESLGAIQEMQEYLRRHPKSEHTYKVETAIAEAFLNLNKYDEALKIYRRLASEGKNSREKSEAFYRIGDVYMEKGDWKAAERQYLEALKNYPEEGKMYPNGLYNLAESRFQMRKHKDSLETYISFLQTFPSHDFGGYAMARIGENLESLGADRSKVIGAFLETHFRYHKHPGADVARIRMLSQQMHGMKDKELRKTLTELREISARLKLKRTEEFVSLMTADGYQRRGDHKQALNELIGYYQTHPTTADLELFRARIHRNIVEVLKGNVSKGDFASALNFYERYSKNWLSQSQRLDVPYFVGQAYEQAGVQSEAGRLYLQVLKRISGLKGKPEFKERQISEVLPTEEALRLRLAAVAVNAKNFPEAYNHLVKIPTEVNLTDGERIERISLLADVSEARGDLNRARKYLQAFIDNWKGDPGQMRSTQLKAASLEAKLKRFPEVEKLVDQIIASNQMGEAIEPATMARALELKGDALLGQGKRLAAVETFQKLLSDYESVVPLGQVRFRTGEILFEAGDTAGAERVWLQLDEQKYGALKSLAQSRLSGAKWRADYGKYVKRIPAMASEKKE